MSTQDAKEFLARSYPHLAAGQWKRTSKRKNDKGQWVRDFSHGSGQVVSLMEHDGEFVVVPHAQSAPPSPAAFSQEELAGARALLARFRQVSDHHYQHDDEEDEGEAEDVIQGSLEFAKFAHALPGVMSFYFPPDTYENPDTHEADINQPAHRLCVTFVENGKDISDGGDYYYQWMVPQHCIPELSSCDETNFEIVDETMSVAQLIQAMQARGFTYYPSECLFGPLMQGHAPVPSLRATAAVESFALRSQAVDAIANNDAATLEALLSQGLQWNAPLGNGHNLVEFAIEKDAKDCFDILLPRVSALPQDTLTAAWGHVRTRDKDRPDRYYLPALSTAWDFDGAGVVRNAIFIAMEPLGKTLAPVMLETARERDAHRAFAKHLLCSMADYPICLRNKHVQQAVDEAISQDPTVLVDEETSPITRMVEIGNYGMAGDWIARHQLPVDQLRAKGKPLLDYLRERLDAATSRRAGRTSFLVATNRQGQVIPDREDIDVRDIPGLLMRLSRLAGTPGPGRGPRP